MSDHQITRRTLIGTAAASGVAGAALTGVAPGAAGRKPVPRRPASPRRADVVVVGAGLAGLVAARELAGAGRSVIVLRCSRRCGIA
jgi:monoamine oxidase